ncbi:MAG: hypothetical protein PHR22_02655 [Candidatus Omnitrophica bacterium]|nr:hypothetical protein [Candidatus Omnitrophota bacterium]
MNKRAVSIFVFLLLGVAYMVTCSGCSGAGKYKKYSSKDPELNITMDYIPGWESSETRGAHNSYADVFFGEPWDKVGAKTRRAAIEVTSVQASRAGEIQAFAEGIIAGKLKLNEGKLLDKAEIKLPAGKAMDLTFSSKGLDKLYSASAKLIPVKERVVILKNGGRVYTVRYENREEAFEKYSKDFSHIVKSIRFKEKR